MCSYIRSALLYSRSAQYYLRSAEWYSRRELWTFRAIINFLLFCRHKQKIFPPTGKKHQLKRINWPLHRYMHIYIYTHTFLPFIIFTPISLHFAKFKKLKICKIVELLQNVYLCIGTFSSVHPDGFSYFLSGTGAKKLFHFFNLSACISYVKTKQNGLQILQQQKYFQETQICFPKRIKYWIFWTLSPNHKGTLCVAKLSIH